MLADIDACVCQLFQLVKKVLLDKPGGAAVLKEYEDTGSICDSSRRQMVNILAAHMTETEGYGSLKLFSYLRVEMQGPLIAMIQILCLFIFLKGEGLNCKYSKFRDTAYSL